MPKDESGKPDWVERDHPPASEVRLADFVGSAGEVPEDPYAANLLFTGDSLDVLRILCEVPGYRAIYRGKVKLVYIDPPFNTGQAFEHYDDWMEHSTWLPFMRERLLLITDLLAPDGSVWVYLDDAEVHDMRVMMDEVFGAKNFLGAAIWKRRNDPRNTAQHLTMDHDTLLVFARDLPRCQFNQLPRTAAMDSAYTNPDGDPRGPCRAATDPNQGSLFEVDEHDDAEAGARHTGLVVSTMDARVSAGEASAETLRRVLTPRTPGGVKIPLFLPSVVTRWERDRFTLASINLDSVEALGRTFAEDNAPTLTRKAIDAERDVTGGTHVVIRGEIEQVIATQTVMPFDTIENDLVGRLIRTNDVEASVTELNAAVGVARAFLAGAGFTEETPWRPEHGRLATARLTEWIRAKQTSSPAREVREVWPVRWPEPSERYATRPAADRQVVTSPREFVRGYPYDCYAKAVYEVNAFDAYSTEFMLADLFEKSAPVRAWVRIDETVPLRITYLSGAVQRQYEPDFIVTDDAGVHWIVEGKRDADLASHVVIAKRDAAAAWVKTVNGSDELHKTWAYLLATESVCSAATSWEALKSGVQVFR